MRPDAPRLGTVLFVDDEPFVLSALRRAFGGSPFAVLAAGSPADALDILGRGGVDLVVTDVRMPEMDGVRLLEEVRRRHPQVDRAILSGHVDRDAAIASVTSGLSRAHFSKPWDATVLERRIASILRTRALLRQQGLAELIAGVESLPALPAVYQELSVAIERGRPIAEIARIIERDVGLASRVMRVASSAFYGQREVAAVGRAIAVLGLDATRDITLIVALAGDPSWPAPDRAELARIVVHSVLTNRLTGEAWRLHHGRALEGASSAGLLHDAGALLLLRSFPERYRDVVARARRDGLGFHAAEVALGWAETAHTRLGGFLLDRWNLPQPLVETALCHHEPALADEQLRPAVEAVAYADRIAHAVTDDNSWALDPAAEGYLGRRDTERLMVDAGRMAVAIERLLPPM